MCKVLQRCDVMQNRGTDSVSQIQRMLYLRQYLPFFKPHCPEGVVSQVIVSWLCHVSLTTRRINGGCKVSLIPRGHWRSVTNCVQAVVERWGGPIDPNGSQRPHDIQRIYFPIRGLVVSFFQFLIRPLPYSSWFCHQCLCLCALQFLVFNRIHWYHTPRLCMTILLNCGRSPGELQKRKQDANWLERRKRHENNLATHPPLSDPMVLEKTPYPFSYSQWRSVAIAQPALSIMSMTFSCDVVSPVHRHSSVLPHQSPPVGFSSFFVLHFGSNEHVIYILWWIVVILFSLFWRRNPLSSIGHVYKHHLLPVSFYTILV